MHRVSFLQEFNFGQLLFEAVFDIIGTFGRNRIKLSKIFENLYFCLKNPNFRENLNSLDKSVHVLIHPYFWQYVWQHWRVRILNPYQFFKQKLLRIKFPIENLVEAYLHLSQEWNQGLQRSPFLIYYNVPELESRFTLGMNAAKNIDCIKKRFKEQLFRIKLPSKTQWKHISISARSGARASKDCNF